MRLVLSGINGTYLPDIANQARKDTEEVLAAVAYATESSLLFDWCWNNNIPLKFWGRLDDSVPVSINILKKFLENKSAMFSCKLVTCHHAKVIWWRGFGLYIGSANLTQSAWYSNVEAGCFFNEEEVTQEIQSEIEEIFKTLELHSTPLNEELVNALEERSKIIYSKKVDSTNFWKSPSIKKWRGLVQVNKQSASEKNKQEFLEEWHSALQHMRNIAEIVSQDNNRPKWISHNVPTGAQADQFLHAHYYMRTFDGRKANYEEHYSENSKRSDEARNEAISWWSKLPSAPNSEDIMLNQNAPFIEQALNHNEIDNIDLEKFHNICWRVNSIRDYARRVSNKYVELKTDGTSYNIDQKIEALSKKIWTTASGNGSNVVDVLKYILYAGSSDNVPERLWDAVTDPDWKIQGLGVSAFGELVGWALPEQFPPRNGRTSKALRSLGYNVRVHVD